MIENINRNCVGADNNENLLKLSILFGFVSFRFESQETTRRKKENCKIKRIHDRIDPSPTKRASVALAHTERERERGCVDGSRLAHRRVAHVRKEGGGEEWGNESLPLKEQGDGRRPRQGRARHFENAVPTARISRPSI